MFKKLIYGAAVMFVFAAVIVSCGKEEAAVTSDSSSFYKSATTDFPTCNTGRTGHLAYATDTSKFYHCSGTAWTEVSIAGATGATGTTGATGATGASGSFSVYSGSTAIGTLKWADWPGVAIEFSNSAQGMFTTDGYFNNSMCVGGYCSPVPVTKSGTSTTMQLTASSTTTSFPTANNSATKSYVLFDFANCTGVAYTQFKPQKNAIFMVSSGTFVKSAGGASSTSAVIRSVMVYDTHLGTGYTNGACTSTGVSGAACCNVDAVSMTSVYAVGTTSYSFPTASGTYPFTGPLEFY